MESDDIESKKKDILSKIFVREEDTLRELEEIVDKSTKHFRINPHSDRPILFEEHIIQIPYKILLLLIGLYLMKHEGARENDSINISQMEKVLGIKKTSLSKPLGNFVQRGYVKKDSLGNYSIEHYQIKKILGDLDK